MTSIDINCDMGELWELQNDGTQSRLMQYVSSVNIACGAHAGDERLMEETIREAMRAGVAIGAHPGYADRENFGRVAVALSSEDLIASIVSQLDVFGRIADRCGANIVHLKPHGALYNVAVKDRSVAEAIAAAARSWGRNVTLVGLAGSPMLATFAEFGFPTMAEAFADRRYQPDGSLRPRNLPDAVIADPEEAAEQVARLLRDHVVKAWDGTVIPLHADTICIHSDSPGAVATAVRIHKTGLVRRVPAAPQTPPPE